MCRDSQRPAPVGADPAARAWVELVLLVLFELVVVQGFTQHVDLHPADEALYQQRGQRLLDLDFDEGSWVFAPVYAAAYATLRLLPLRGDTIQDTMGVLLALASTLAVWWAARGLMARPAAILAGAWWGASLPVLASSLRVYLFSATLTTVAVGLAARRRVALAMIVLGLAALNRPELLPWLVVAAAGLALWALRRHRHGQAVVVLAVLVAGLAFGAGLARPEFRHRQWFTFRWDYAAHFQPGDDVSYVEGAPVTRADAVVEAAFPGCRSVADAVRENPGAVLEHVGRNLRLVPGNLRDLMAIPWWHLPRLRWTLVALGALAAAVGLLVGVVQRGATKPPANVPALLTMGASLCILGPMVVFLPRPDYLMPVGVVLLLGAAGAVARAGSFLCGRLRVGPGTAWGAAAGAVCAAILLVPGPFVSPPAVPCPNRDAVALVAAQGLGDDAVLYAATADGMRTLSSGRFQSGDLQALLAGKVVPDRRPSYLLVGPWDLQGPAAEPVVALLQGGAWQLVDAGSDCWLFVRRT
ncbi:MAG: hypothetical protein R3F56_02890 [Planctomycetota bacterium]